MKSARSMIRRNKRRSLGQTMRLRNRKKHSISMRVRRFLFVSTTFSVRSFSVVNANDLSFLSEKCHPIVDASKEEIIKWSKEGTYPSFVCDQMKKLPVDHADRIREASKILYLHYLITFFKRSMFKRLTGSECGRTEIDERETR